MNYSSNTLLECGVVKLGQQLIMQAFIADAFVVAEK